MLAADGTATTPGVYIRDLLADQWIAVAGRQWSFEVDHERYDRFRRTPPTATASSAKTEDPLVGGPRKRPVLYDVVDSGYSCTTEPTRLGKTSWSPS